MVTIEPANVKEVADFFQCVIDERIVYGLTTSLLDPSRVYACQECIVATVDGQIVGAVTLAFAARNGPTLETMYLLREYRGQGIGGRLCEAAMRRFIELGHVPVASDATTKGMLAILEKLPPELRAVLKLYPSCLQGELELFEIADQDVDDDES